MNLLRAEHKFVGEQEAFTEDGILIHTIRGYSKTTYSTSITIEELQTYFEQYGEVSNVDLQGENGRKYFVIQFASAQSAAKALQHILHSISNKDYFIHGCCSLEQLDEHKILQRLNLTLKHNSLFNNESFWNSSCNQIAETPILALNDDCLALIFKRLTLSDQIHFAASCKRFCAVFAWLNMGRYKTLNTDSLRKLSPLRNGILLLIIGQLVESLILNVQGFVYQSDHYLKFAGSYCTNVKNLTLIKCFKWGGFSIGKFLKRMTSLEELILYVTDSEASFSVHLREFTNFKTLKIYSSRIIDSQMHTLTGLEKLMLKDTERRAPDLRFLCRGLTNLSYLDVRTILLELEAFQLITQHLVQLQTLRITYSKGSLIALAKLPKLKMLELQLEPYIIKTTEKCINDLHLAASMAQQLEEFRIGSYNKFLRSSQIASCLLKLENLKVLHWKMEATNEILSILSQLNKLEEIALGSCLPVTDEGVLSLLKNCSKLKKIFFSILNLKEIDQILLSSFKLLQEQRTGGLRDDRVRFMFEVAFYKQHLEKISQAGIFSEALEISPECYTSEEARLFLLSMGGNPL